MTGGVRFGLDEQPDETDNAVIMDHSTRGDLQLPGFAGERDGILCANPIVAMKPSNELKVAGPRVPGLQPQHVVELVGPYHGVGNEIPVTVTIHSTPSVTLALP